MVDTKQQILEDIHHTLKAIFKGPVKLERFKKAG